MSFTAAGFHTFLVSCHCVPLYPPTPLPFYPETFLTFTDTLIKVVFPILMIAVSLYQYCIVSKQYNWDSLLVECWTHHRKVASLNPGWSGRFLFSRINFLC